MTKRKKVRNKKADKKYFTKTATKTKRINVSPGEWRGGIML